MLDKRDVLPCEYQPFMRWKSVFLEDELDVSQEVVKLLHPQTCDASVVSLLELLKSRVRRVVVFCILVLWCGVMGRVGAPLSNHTPC